MPLLNHVRYRRKDSRLNFQGTVILHSISYLLNKKMKSTPVIYKKDIYFFLPGITDHSFFLCQNCIFNDALLGAYCEFVNILEHIISYVHLRECNYKLDLEAF